MAIKFSDTKSGAGPVAVRRRTPARTERPADPPIPVEAAPAAAMALAETLTRLGLSQERAAALLGVTRLTVNRWANGKVPVPPMVRVLLILIERISVTEVERILDDAR